MRICPAAVCNRALRCITPPCIFVPKEVYVKRRNDTVNAALIIITIFGRSSGGQR